MKQYNLVIKQEMWDALKQIADRDGVAVKAIMVQAFKGFLEKEKVSYGKQA